MSRQARATLGLGLLLLVLGMLSTNEGLPSLPFTPSDGLNIWSRIETTVGPTARAWGESAFDHAQALREVASGFGRSAISYIQALLEWFKAGIGRR